MEILKYSTRITLLYKNYGENKTCTKDSLKQEELKYIKGEYSKKDIEEALRKQDEQQIKNFEKLISSVLNKQANKYIISISKIFKDLGDVISSLEIDGDVINQAKSAISEDGYYSVNKTSERILNFAKAIAGDDLEKLKTMREAVEKGFEKAEKIWGGKLPEISKETYKKVMETFDKWEEEANLNNEKETL